MGIAVFIAFKYINQTDIGKEIYRDSSLISAPFYENLPCTYYDKNDIICICAINVTRKTCKMHVLCNEKPCRNDGTCYVILNYLLPHINIKQ